MAERWVRLMLFIMRQARKILAQRRFGLAPELICATIVDMRILSVATNMVAHNNGDLIDAAMTSDDEDLIGGGARIRG